MAEKRASRGCTRDEAPWKSRSGKCSQTIPTSWAEILGFSGVAIPGVPEPVCYSKRGGHGSRNFAEPNLNAEVSGLCRPANDSIAGCGLSQGTMRSGTPLRGTRRPEQVSCTRRADTAETNIPPIVICVSPQSRVDTKMLRHSFGELHGLPYYCSTAGEALLPLGESL